MSEPRETGPSPRAGRGWRGRPGLRAWIGLALGLGLLVLALRQVEVGQVLQMVGQANVGLLLAAAGLTVVTTVCKTIRWQLLFRPHYRLPLGDLLTATYAGQLVNTILPLRLGELVRALQVSEHRRLSRVFVLSTIGLERALDGLVLAALVGVLLPLMAFPAWFRWSGVVFVLAGGLTLIALLLGARRSVAGAGAGILGQALPRLLWRWLAPRLEAMARSLDALGRLDRVVALGGWTAISWLTASATNHLVGLALGLSLPFTAAMFVLVVVTVGATIPAPPLRIGLFEYLTMLALAVFDVEQGTALAYGVLLHLVAFGPPMLLGALACRQLGLTWRRLPVAEVVGGPR